MFRPQQPTALLELTPGSAALHKISQACRITGNYSYAVRFQLSSQHQNCNSCSSWSNPTFSQEYLHYPNVSCTHVKFSYNLVIYILKYIENSKVPRYINQGLSCEVKIPVDMWKFMLLQSKGVFASLTFIITQTFPHP